MNPLTQEQINKIKTFTPEQKAIYNQNRSAGIPPQDALDIVLTTGKIQSGEIKGRTPSDGILIGEKSLASGISGGIKEIITGGIRQTGEIAQQYGVGEAIQRLPLSLVAGAGRGVGEMFGAVFETVDDLTGETVSGAVQPLIEQAVASPTGQKVIQGIQRFDESTQGVAGDLLDASNLLGIGLLKSAPAKALRESIINKTKTGIIKPITGGPGGGVGPTEKLRDLFKTKKVETPVDVVAPDTFKEAVSTGFTPQEARLFSNVTEVDKPVFNKMLKLTEDINAGKVDATTRASDILGENIVDKRLKPLETIEKEAGKGVDETAKTLEGLPINQNELNSNLLNTVNEYKIARTEKGWDFSDSDFALTTNVQGDIQKALDYVFSPKKDAYAVHRIKKTLDGLIYPQKASEGLSGQAKSLIKKLRRDVDGYLDDTFEAYKIANDKFSEVKNVLDEARDTLGDFNDVKIGARVRQVFSNSPKRKEFIDSLNKIDELAKKYNLEDVGNIYNQALFAEKLIDIFGDNAVTGFGESIKRAVTRAQAVAKGIRNPIQGAGELAGTIIEKVSGQTDADRLQFIKKLLNYEE